MPQMKRAINYDYIENYSKNKACYTTNYKVTVSFAQEANPTLSALVRNTLLDAYIRKNGLCGEEQPA